ncbi:hypothetical protein D9M68_402360 [compost metagenome]
MKPDNEPLSLSSSMETTGRSTIGSVWLKSWNSRPTISPWPRTSLMIFGYFSFSACRRSSR